MRSFHFPIGLKTDTHLLEKIKATHPGIARFEHDRQLYATPTIKPVYNQYFGFEYHERIGRAMRDKMHRELGIGFELYARDKRNNKYRDEAYKLDLQKRIRASLRDVAEKGYYESGPWMFVSRQSPMGLKKYNEIRTKILPQKYTVIRPAARDTGAEGARSASTSGSSDVGTSGSMVPFSPIRGLEEFRLEPSDENKIVIEDKSLQTALIKEVEEENKRLVEEQKDLPENERQPPAIFVANDPNTGEPQLYFAQKRRGNPSHESKMWRWVQKLQGVRAEPWDKFDDIYESIQNANIEWRKIRHRRGGRMPKGVTPAVDNYLVQAARETVDKIMKRYDAEIAKARSEGESALGLKVQQVKLKLARRTLDKGLGE
jgi:hypothetical protein